MTNHSDDAHTLAQLVTQATPTLSSAESEATAIEVLAVFDHDYSCHVLLQEWHHHDPSPRWVYRLWFCDSDIALPVAQFPDAQWPHPPFVAAAQVAQEWRTLSDQDNRRRHEHK